MPILTISTNISPSINYSYRYHKSTDVVPVWISGTSTSSTFTITNSDILNTNYIFEIYNNCVSSTVSNTTTYTTHFMPISLVLGVSSSFGSKLTTVTDGICNVLDNSYIVYFAVRYTSMKNDTGQVVSLVRIHIDGGLYYFTPTYSDSTSLSSILTDGITTVIGEVFYIKLNSDGAFKTAVIDIVPA